MTWPATAGTTTLAGGALFLQLRSWRKQARADPSGPDRGLPWRMCGLEEGGSLLGSNSIELRPRWVLLTHLNGAGCELTRVDSELLGRSSTVTHGRNPGPRLSAPLLHLIVFLPNRPATSVF